MVFIGFDLQVQVTLAGAWIADETVDVNVVHCWQRAEGFLNVSARFLPGPACRSSSFLSVQTTWHRMSVCVRCLLREQKKHTGSRCTLSPVLDSQSVSCEAKVTVHPKCRPDSPNLSHRTRSRPRPRRQAAREAGFPVGSTRTLHRRAAAKMSPCILTGPETVLTPDRPCPANSTRPRLQRPSPPGESRISPPYRNRIF